MAGVRLMVVGINYAPEPVGIGPYTAQMCEGLVRRGHQVTAIAAQPYYPAWRISDDFRGGWSRSDERGVVVVRCPLYVPARASGGGRRLQHPDVPRLARS